MKNQTIFRSCRRENFTTIPNEILHDPELSWKAKGLLVFLLSLPKDWVASAAYLQSKATDGIDSVYSGLRELIEQRFVWRRVRGGNKGGGWEYLVFDYRKHDSPFEEIPNGENPRSEKSPTTNNVEVIEKERIKETKDESSGLSDFSEDSGKDEDAFFFSLEKRKPQAKRRGDTMPAAKSYRLGTEIMRAWNETGRLPNVRSLDRKRQAAVRKMLDEVPDFEDRWAEAIRKAAESDFCCGDNDRGWKLRFDGFLTPRLFNNLLEGKYDNKRSNQKNDDEDENNTNIMSLGWNKVNIMSWE